MTDRQIMHPINQDKPDITDALNWLASHSGKYSVMILDHIADIGFINDGLHRENAMLKNEISHLQSGK